MNNHHLTTDAVYNVLSDLTPNPFPTREGEQELKPLSWQGRGLERGFNNNLHVIASTSTQTAQLIPSNSPAIENPSAWIREGNSPTEIILATAILSSLLMGGIAGVIVAMTGLVKTINSTTVNQTTRNKKYFRKGVN